MPGLMNDNQYGLWNNALNSYIPTTPAEGDTSFYDSVYLNKLTSTPQTVAGPVAFAGDGLKVGTTQVVTSGGRTGFGRTPITYQVEVLGDVMATGEFRGGGAN